MSPEEFQQAISELQEMEPGPLYLVDREAFGEGVLKASPPGDEVWFDLPMAAVRSLTPISVDSGDPSRLLLTVAFKEGFESLPDTFGSLIQATTRWSSSESENDAGLFITLPEETLAAVDTEAPVIEYGEERPEAELSGLEARTVRFHRKTFFDNYRRLFNTTLRQSQVDGIQALLGFIEEDANMADVRWVAYLMATIKHECADRWRPIEEFSSGRQYCGRADLGNTQAGDGPRFKGRGYVQITGRANYKRLGKLLGVDLVSSPLRALEPSISYKIASLGMRKGLFTGKKLADHIHGSTCDYRNARRNINALDRANLIKGYAMHLEAALRASQNA